MQEMRRILHKMTKEKYKALVEADAIVTVMAESEEEAEEKLEQVRTGQLGPANVKGVQPFDA